MTEELPPQLQHQILQLQQVQQQLELLTVRRRQLEGELKETERAISELEKLESDTTVYKFIGAILAQVDKNKLVEELKDKKETLEMQIKVVQRQEERTRNQLKELRNKIQQALAKRGSEVAE